MLGLPARADSVRADSPIWLHRMRLTMRLQLHQRILHPARELQAPCFYNLSALQSMLKQNYSVRIGGSCGTIGIRMGPAAVSAEAGALHGCKLIIVMLLIIYNSIV